MQLINTVLLFPSWKAKCPDKGQIIQMFLFSLEYTNISHIYSFTMKKIELVL